MTHRYRFLEVLLVLCLSVFLTHIGLSQIPNAGFENWTGGSPDGWLTNNSPGNSFFPITKSTTAHSGTGAMQGTATSLFTFVFAPQALSGPNGVGFPISARYTTLDGFYRLSPVSGDRFIISVLMVMAGNAIGGGAFMDSLTVGTYTAVSIPILYTSPGTPDTGWIQVTMIPASDSSSVHVGSSFLLDDLAFGNATGVDGGAAKPWTFALGQNFPNPFNPATTIRYSLPSRSDVRLTIYDPLGREVAELVNGTQEAGSHEVRWNAGSLSSGVYYYRLSAGSAVEMKRLLLVK